MSAVYSAENFTEALERAFDNRYTWAPRQQAAIGNAIWSKEPVVHGSDLFYTEEDVTGRRVLVHQIRAAEYHIVVER